MKKRHLSVGPELIMCRATVTHKHEGTVPLLC